MNYGMYISASGALTSMHRQDVYANNLANINTVGYKPDAPQITQRHAARIEDGLMSMPSNELLERLGAGVAMLADRTSFAQGALQVTERPLDVAIEGDGFLKVMETGRDGQQSVRLTRDGRFSRDNDGRLVLASSGAPVLDAGNNPIQLPHYGEVNIDNTGLISVDGLAVAQLALVDVPKGALRKIGAGLFSAPPGAIAGASAGSGRVMQGHVERAAVNEIDAMMKVTSAAKAVSANIGMISYHDRLMDQAINRFGRVA
jgi:flagellar basal body rod protein FlgG